MRKYILTDWEKNVVRRYVADQTPLDGFRVIKNRFIEAYPEILKDLMLLAKFSAALEANPHSKIPEEFWETIREMRGWVIDHLKNLM